MMLRKKVLARGARGTAVEFAVEAIHPAAAHRRPEKTCWKCKPYIQFVVSMLLHTILYCTYRNGAELKGSELSLPVRTVQKNSTPIGTNI